MGQITAYKRYLCLLLSVVVESKINVISVSGTEFPFKDLF